MFQSQNPIQSISAIKSAGQYLHVLTYTRGTYPPCKMVILSKSRIKDGVFFLVQFAQLINQ